MLQTPSRSSAEPRVLAPFREEERPDRDLLEGLPAAVYATDADGRLTFCNEAARRLWGRDPVLHRERWCGAHRIFEADGSEIPLERCHMAQVVRGAPAMRNVEVVIERPDGTRRHVLANPQPMLDRAGRIVGAINMLVDITERKRAEAELAATKDQLAQQVESLTCLHDLAMRLGGISDVDAALRAILQTAVQAQGADFGLIWLHDGEDTLVARASEGFPGEALLGFQRIPVGTTGGSAGKAFARNARWVIEDVEADAEFAPYLDGARRAGFRAVHSTPIVTRAGTLLGVISVHFAKVHAPAPRDMQVADVCARHAADAIEANRNQEALRASERVYRAIGESLNYGIWITDAEGRNTYASESFLRLVGVELERWRREGLRAVVHPEDAPALYDRWKECVRTGEHFDQEYRVRCVHGGYQAVLARGVPVRDDHGHIVAWAGINLDIERLKQVENELRELDQRKNEFLATLAHELRNPLAPLRNGLEVLRLAGPNAAMADKARAMMERQLGQMVRLVDDLLDVSRVSRGKIELRREELELSAVLRNAIETSQPLISARGHELATRIAPQRVVVDADMTRLSQVFWNLLNNAAKYTEPGGRIELVVRPLEAAVEVCIRDNGIGIPAEMQSRVFDIFTQVDRSLEKSQGGLGIGLSIAKRLVEMHGGTIRVTSGGHRKGSEFVVRLPARIGGVRPEVGTETGRYTRGDGERHRIVICDDNADSVETLRLMLEVLGHEVRTASDGEEAVRLAAEYHPDAMLLDIGMPRMNGYDACARIRTQPGGRDIFMVALTGWAQEEDRSRAHAAGFDRHLVKPVEPGMLERLIAEVPVRATAPSS